MQYVSTRGAAPALDFGDVLLTGLATDGGLYVPAEWPPLPDTARAADLSYAELARAVMYPFVEGVIASDDFGRLVADAYATFHHEEVIPFREIGPDHWLMELFWGPTLAFKDVALQLVGRLFDHELTARSERRTIVGATSGDTGSAAIAACRDRPCLDVFILFPEGRVSEVQRRQMTTVDAANVHCVEIRGTFDDCQDLVKAMFGDESFRSEQQLGAVNSINWARVMAQVVYYVWAGRRFGELEKPVSFSVPTGNFGNVFAGEVARRMGVPVGQFIVASNRNDILTQFFGDGSMTIGEVHPTLSPSMDIQVSSNLERLLFELLGRDGVAMAEFMARFRGEGHVGLEAEQFALTSEHWTGASVDDAGTSATIARYYADQGYLLDPHTAVGVQAAERCRRDTGVPLITLATAHPAKFPDAVEAATGVRPELPPHLADLHTRAERYVTLDNDLATVSRYVAENR
ncbi:MAG: threonine synthase [Acidimicrobiales bacterium]|nr:threonine synthase [Acidimicrobiales bacterium]